MSAATKLYIGLDVGRTIDAALVRRDGSIVCREKIVSEVRDPQAFLSQLADVINKLRKASPPGETVVAAGLGWPGLVNMRDDRLEVAPNMLDIISLDLFTELPAATGIPVIFDNDANAGVYGEWCCGAAQGYDDIIYITLGTGIGAGLILGGKLHRGSVGYAGEFGHFKIEIEGLECGCGSHGCLETLTSGPNIVRRVRELLFSDPAFSVSQMARESEGIITCESLVQAAVKDDELAKSVLRETAVFLGMAIANVINLLNVEIVVLGGGVMAAGDILLEPLREETRKRTLQPAFDTCQIVSAQLGKDGGIIGAAMLARDTRFEFRK